MLMFTRSIALGACIASVALGQAQALELDPCVTEKAKFETTADALRGRTVEILTKFASWNDKPDLIPEDTLKVYRDAVRDYAFGIWKETPAGKGVLESWQPLPDEAAAKVKFLTFVYAKEVSPELEKKLAQSVYQKDYAENIKPKLASAAAGVNNDINNNKAKLDESCSQSEFSRFMRVTLGNAMIIVNGNFDAAKNESGEIAKAVRAITGISITDILKNGLQGGENSEVAKFNKMLEGVLDRNGMGSSTVAGQVLNSINPTKWKISLPEAKLPSKIDTTIRIDEGSFKNTITNVTGGLVKF